MAVLLYTAALDDRYGSGRIESRIGLSSPAEIYHQTTDLYASIRPIAAQKTISCVLLDEAQFLSAPQVDQLARVADELNIPVLCYGLRTDFLGRLFDGSRRLLAIADNLKELKTVCACGRKATMTVRLDDNGRAVTDGRQVEIGGNDRYVSKCRKHYHALIRQHGDDN